MWLGIAIVAISVVAGVRLVGAADESISVWAVSDDLGAGTTLQPDQLEARSIRFVDPGDAERYLPTEETLPAELFLTRAIGAGELLPRSALGSADDAGVVEVPIAVESEAIPPSVEVGSRVDLYVSDESRARRPAELLLEDVVVVSAPRLRDSFGAGGTRQIVLGIPAEDATRLGEVVAGARAGAITVVGRSAP